MEVEKKTRMQKKATFLGNKKKKKEVTCPHANMTLICAIEEGSSIKPSFTEP